MPASNTPGGITMDRGLPCDGRVEIRSDSGSEGKAISDHPLLEEKDNLVKFALTSFKTGKFACDTMTRKIRQPTKTLPNRAIIRRREKLISPRSAASSTPPKQLACPFYLKYPEKHVKCLKHSDLRTISDVVDHMCYQHRQPFYCPACKSTFNTAAGRDSHIVDRSCEIKDGSDPDGISEDQKWRLLRITKPLNQKRGYVQIWRILFPESPQPTSHNLCSATELTITSFRQYWSLHGRTLVSDYLRQRNLKGFGIRSEERDLSALYSLVLNEVLDILVAEHY